MLQSSKLSTCHSGQPKFAKATLSFTTMTNESTAAGVLACLPRRCGLPAFFPSKASGSGCTWATILPSTHSAHMQGPYSLPVPEADAAVLHLPSMGTMTSLPDCTAGTPDEQVQLVCYSHLGQRRCRDRRLSCSPKFFLPRKDVAFQASSVVVADMEARHDHPVGVQTYDGGVATLKRLKSVVSI